LNFLGKSLNLKRKQGKIVMNFKIAQNLVIKTTAVVSVATLSACVSGGAPRSKAVQVDSTNSKNNVFCGFRLCGR
jgi:hypothetical protein